MLDFILLQESDEYYKRKRQDLEMDKMFFDRSEKEKTFRTGRPDRRSEYIAKLDEHTKKQMVTLGGDTLKKLATGLVGHLVFIGTMKLGTRLQIETEYRGNYPRYSVSRDQFIFELAYPFFD